MKILTINKEIFSRRFFIVVFCVAVIIIFAVYYINRQPAAHWKDLEISQIYLTGVESEFSIKDGAVYENGKVLNGWFNNSKYDRVLKLALFYQWLKEDPLLFDPNLDRESFDVAIERMKKQNDLASSATNFGYVNPVLFLQSFSKSSAAWEKFSKNVSEDNAKEMISAMNDARTNYTSDAGRIGGLFDETLAKGLGGNRLNFLGGETVSTIGIMAEDFGKIRKNGELLGEEIQKRQACLEDFVCQRAADSFSIPTQQKEIAAAELASLPKEDANLQK